MKFLFINPNTSAAVSETIKQVAESAASPGTEISVVNASFGPEYITNRSENTIAAHAALATLAEQLKQTSFDGIAIAAFTDAGLTAARECAPCPVVGIVEAAMQAAASTGNRFAVVTPAADLVSLTGELAHAYGVGDRYVGAFSVPAGAIDLVGDVRRSIAILKEVAVEAIQKNGAETIVVGGAPLAIVAEELSTLIDASVVDGVATAVGRLELEVNGGANRRSDKDRVIPNSGKTAKGIAPALAEMLGLSIAE